VPERVRILEVGPRDGLQNEGRIVPTAEKLRFIGALAEAGLREIEVSSFVHPELIPQLADAEALVAGLPAGDGVTYSALVPNERGLDRALATGIRRIAVFTAASETFTQRNIRMSIAESFAVFGPLVARAKAAGLSVRGYLSVCFVCPYEGDIPKERVRPLVERLLELGVDEVGVSDTIGAAAPREVSETTAFLLERVPATQLALHLHDTYGTALANVHAGLALGIRSFDAATAGLGGCPYAPGAAGNLATEDLVYMLERMGYETGIDLEVLVAAGAGMAGFLSRQPTSRQWKRLGGGGR
jgi:hydroxymethylglutaryl-CoA lyase